MLLHLALAGVERGLNRVLALDATAGPRLARLSGKVIEIDCQAPALRLFLLPQGEELRLAQHWDAPADCRLRAPASELLRLGFNHDKVAVLHGPQIDLDGDSAALIDLAGILQDLELDWDYQLGEWLGPVAGHLLSSQLRGMAGWAGQSVGSLRLNLADYLAEETRSLVGAQEADARFAELDRLKLTLDRLDARIDRLIQGRKTAP